MAQSLKVLCTEQKLEEIAEAIREKKGVSVKYTLDEMPPAIRSIPTGGDPPTGQIDITDITESGQGNPIDVTNYALAYVNSPALRAENIRRGTIILGVTGTYGPSGTKSVSMATTSVVTEDVASFENVSIQLSGAANITPENIRSGVTFLGVTGSYAPPTLVGTANPADVRATKVFYSDNYTPQVGTMANATIAVEDYQLLPPEIIPYGKYLNIQSGYAPEDRTFRPGKPTLSGDAVESQVLVGRTFYSTDVDIQKTGTMPTIAPVISATGSTQPQIVQPGQHIKLAVGYNETPRDLQAAEPANGTVTVPSTPITYAPEVAAYVEYRSGDSGVSIIVDPHDFTSTTPTTGAYLAFSGQVSAHNEVAHATVTAGMVPNDVKNVTFSVPFTRGETIYAPVGIAISQPTITDSGTAAAIPVEVGEYVYIPYGFNTSTKEYYAQPPIMDGTAISSHVLIGETFYSDTLTKQTGTMPTVSFATHSTDPSQGLNYSEDDSGSGSYRVYAVYEDTSMIGPDATSINVRPVNADGSLGSFTSVTLTEQSYYYLFHKDNWGLTPAYTWELWEIYRSQGVTHAVKSKEYSAATKIAFRSGTPYAVSTYYVVSPDTSSCEHLYVPQEMIPAPTFMGTISAGQYLSMTKGYNETNRYFQAGMPAAGSVTVNPTTTIPITITPSPDMEETASSSELFAATIVATRPSSGYYVIVGDNITGGTASTQVTTGAGYYENSVVTTITVTAPDATATRYYQLFPKMSTIVVQGADPSSGMGYDVDYSSTGYTQITCVVEYDDIHVASVGNPFPILDVDVNGNVTSGSHTYTFVSGDFTYYVLVRQKVSEFAYQWTLDAITTSGYSITSYRTLYTFVSGDPSAKLGPFYTGNGAVASQYYVVTSNGTQNLGIPKSSWQPTPVSAGTIGVNEYIAISQGYNDTNKYYHAIPPTLVGDTTPGQVLIGQKFYSDNLTLKTGTMPYASSTISATAASSPTSVEAGKYANIDTGYIQSPITFYAQPSNLTGDAIASQVLTGKEFYSNNANQKLTGTMPYATFEKASYQLVPFESLAAGQYLNITAGYNSEARTYKADAQTALTGNALPEEVVSGRTFYSNNYTKQTGTMPTVNIRTHAKDPSIGLNYDVDESGRNIYCVFDLDNPPSVNNRNITIFPVDEYGGVDSTNVIHSTVDSGERYYLGRKTIFAAVVTYGWELWKYQYTNGVVYRTKIEDYVSGTNVKLGPFNSTYAENEYYVVDGSNNNLQVPQQIVPTPIFGGTIPMGRYLSILKGYNDTNRYYQAASPTLSGDAQPNEVLAGKKFYSDSMTIKTGTLAATTLSASTTIIPVTPSSSQTITIGNTTDVSVGSRQATTPTIPYIYIESGNERSSISGSFAHISVSPGVVTDTQTATIYTSVEENKLRYYYPLYITGGGGETWSYGDFTVYGTPSGNVSDQNLYVYCTDALNQSAFIASAPDSGTQCGWCESYMGGPSSSNRIIDYYGFYYCDSENNALDTIILLGSSTAGFHIGTDGFLPPPNQTPSNCWGLSLSFSTGAVRTYKIKIWYDSATSKIKYKYKSV